MSPLIVFLIILIILFGIVAIGIINEKWERNVHSTVSSPDAKNELEMMKNIDWSDVDDPQLVARYLELAPWKNLDWSDVDDPQLIAKHEEWLELVDQNISFNQDLKKAIATIDDETWYKIEEDNEEVFEGERGQKKIIYSNLDLSGIEDEGLRGKLERFFRGHAQLEERQAHLELKTEELGREIEKYTEEKERLAARIRERTSQLQRIGSIYILINPSLQKDYLKIGKTSRIAEERAHELSSATGVPTPFHVAYEARVSDCDRAERAIHKSLENYRVVGQREFFQLPLKVAIEIVSEVIKEYEINTDYLDALEEQLDSDEEILDLEDEV